MGVDVKPLPGLEHLPYAEVWLRSPDEALWRDASAAAHAIGKDGLEVWTTDETPEVTEATSSPSSTSRPQPTPVRQGSN